jgi:glutamine amidotransferase
MIVIIDYGMGNLRSVWKAFERVGAKARVSDRSSDIEKADAVVLPGVGAFAPAMRHLKERDLLGPIREVLAARSKPFLGICLGLQLLMQDSEEAGVTQGLGLIPGRCKRFVTDLKVPHMGWNQVELVQEGCPLFEGVPSGSFFYFVHSYYVDPEQEGWTCGRTVYDKPFTSAIARDGKIFALQFHPEKSQEKGLQLLRNFSRMAEK